MVPREWDVRPLSDIARITSGGTPSRAKAEYWKNGTVPWIRTTEVQNCILNPTDTQEYISEEGLKNSSAKLVPSGTVLLAMIGQGKTRGQVALLNFEATVNQNCAAIIFNDDQEPAFHFNFLLSQYENIRGMSNSAGQSNLSGALVKAIKTPVPPLPEQKKIAKILYTWDKAITTTEQLLANSQQQKKALMQQLLTGKKRLLDSDGVRFGGEWEASKLSKVISSLDSGVSVNGVEQEVHCDYFVLKTSCVSGETFIAHERKKVVEIKEISRLKEPLLNDSILISRMNTPTLVGANAYVKSAPKNTFLPDRLWQVKVISNKVLMRWIGFWFASKKTRTSLSDLASGTSGSMKNISKKSVLDLNIKLPSLQEQKKIAKVLSTADDEITTLQKKLDALKQEKKALMQQLLTGKRRVAGSAGGPPAHTHE